MKAPAFAFLLAAALAAGGCDRPPAPVGDARFAGLRVASTAAPADPSSPNASLLAPDPKSGLGGAFDDTVTTGKVKAAIAADAGMRDSDVSVSTRDGIVVLSGTVKSEDQITIATHLAQRQAGVRRVETHLTVR